jgi:threonine dehydrogenase-like Zn-dependent dehydrogenase
MKALRLNDRLELVSDASVPRRYGESLVAVTAAGICNTDLEIVKGYAGFLGIPGHEFVGVVAESPDASLEGKRVVGEINAGCGLCDLCAAGDPRHCSTRTVLGIKDRDGAFAEFLSLPSRNLIEVPKSITNEQAVFVEPLAAALGIRERVELDANSKIAVIGDGKLAQLIVRALVPSGCQLTMIGKHQEKLDLARGIAAGFILVNDTFIQRSAAGEVTLLNWGEERFDIVIEASGSETGLPLAIEIVKPRGVIVLKSTYHKGTLLYSAKLVVNEISLIGSRCGRFKPAIDLLASGSLDLSALISARFSLDDGLAAFEAARQSASLKVIIDVR